MKRRIIILLLVLAIVFTLTACNKKKSGDDVEITVAFHLLPNGLEPLSEDSVQNFAIVYHVYDRLVTFDPLTNAWGPAVAKSWERVDDVTWKFEIDLRYKFQNGDQLTMDDVVYSLLRLRDIPKTADSGNLIQSVTYEGSTLTFVTVNAANTIPSRVLSTAVIVQKKYVENGGDDAIYLNPIGTGPYKVTEFTPGASATIEAWDGYPFDMPQITKINYIAIAENAARYIALETGQCQYAHFLTAYEIDLAEQNDSLATISVMSRRANCWCFNCEQPPFDNINVRRAIIYAFDRAAFCSLQGGRPPIVSMLFAGYDDLYVESANMPHFDLEIARQMLAAEGYDESNPLRFELFGYQADPGHELFQSSLKSIGVEMSINMVEFSVFLAAEGSGGFDLINTTQINRGNHPLMDLDRYDINMLGMRDISRYYNPRVQELVEAMRTENDPARLRAMNIEINDILAQEVPMVGTMLQPIFAAVDKNLTGVVIDPGQIASFRGCTYTG